MQPSPSCVHVAVIEGFTQMFPTALHTGSVLHVHLAAPGVPVHDWCTPHFAGVLP
jgi:hypothetical protein